MHLSVLTSTNPPTHQPTNPPTHLWHRRTMAYTMEAAMQCTMECTWHAVCSAPLGVTALAGEGEEATRDVETHHTRLHVPYICSAFAENSV